MTTIKSETQERALEAALDCLKAFADWAYALREENRELKADLERALERRAQ